MDDEDDPYTRVARGINKRWEVGFEPGKDAWQSLSQAMQTVPEMAEQKTWGITVSTYQTMVDFRKPLADQALVKLYRVVANPEFYYPRAVVAMGLTYVEAVALKKLMES